MFVKTPKATVDPDQLRSYAYQLAKSQQAAPPESPTTAEAMDDQTTAWKHPSDAFRVDL